MSKKKNNNQTAESQVVENEENVETAAEETTVETEAPVDEAPETEETETPADEENPTDEAPKTEDSEVEPPADEAPETPADKEESDSVEDTPEQNTINSDVMNRELMTSYKVRFAFSQSSKKYAAQRNMTLFNMIDVFMTNRQGFVGCTEQKDFDHIKDFVLHNPIIYKYTEFKLDGRRQFIERLEINTNYVIDHIK